MKNIEFTQLSISELRSIIRQELERFFSDMNGKTYYEDELMGLDEACKLLNLKSPTIYGLVHKKQIPFSKKGKKLYFSKPDLLKWIKAK